MCHKRFYIRMLLIRNYSSSIPARQLLATLVGLERNGAGRAHAANARLGSRRWLQIGGGSRNWITTSGRCCAEQRSNRSIGASNRSPKLWRDNCTPPGFERPRLRHQSWRATNVPRSSVRWTSRFDPYASQSRSRQGAQSPIRLAVRHAFVPRISLRRSRLLNNAWPCALQVDIRRQTLPE